MFFMILYLLGLAAGVVCVVDIAKRKDVKTPKKIWLSAILLLLSWIGVIYYIYVLSALLGRENQ